MKKLITWVAVLSLMPVGHVLADDVAAQPIERPAPEYPNKCEDDVTDKASKENVEILFDISEVGATENIRVVRSTEECFEAAAVAAVSAWRYSPRLVDGYPSIQHDNEITLIFQLAPYTASEEIVRPAIGAIPPVYPSRCEADAQNIEYVKVRYDISTTGVTENVEVIGTTNSCFNESAISQVRAFEYEANRPVRKGVEVTLTYRLEN